MTTYENPARPATASVVQRFTDPTTWSTFGSQWHSGEQKPCNAALCARKPMT
ncbi:hypothetical protein THH46_20530 [Pseudomonas sp. NA13]